MPVPTVAGDGTRWLRHGECNGCGECCNYVDPVAVTGYFTDEELAAATEPTCPMLRRDGDRFVCAGHGEHSYYLAGCNTYPTGPQDLEHTPSCSYWFEAVE